MANDDEILRQLLGTFQAELDEHLQAMNRLLLSLERETEPEHRRELFEEIFREAHSLKGAARAVNAEAIEQIAHRMETVFAAAKRAEIDMTAESFDGLYRSLDAISAAMESQLAGNDLPFNLDDMLADLDAQARGRGEAPNGKRPRAPGPEAKPKPVRTAPALQATIRVSTKKLDSLMTHVEELLVSKIRTEQRLSELKEVKTFIADWQKQWLKIKGTYEQAARAAKAKETQPVFQFLDRNRQSLRAIDHQIGKLLQEFSKDTMRMSFVTEDLQTDIRRVRMLPVSTVFDTYERMVRDIGREQSKDVNLRLVGAETELDKKILEEIKDPIMHLLRNCVDHGIEPPDVRTSQGKPREGKIVLTTRQQGSNIVIEVEDDGGGIDVDAARQAAVSKSLIGQAEAKSLSDEEARFLIFRSGFSTSPIITSVSGRGVGLDVVKANVERLNGLIDLQSTAGVGAKFSITLPLTLTTSRVLLVQAAGEAYAIPTSAVERILRVSSTDVFTVGSKEAIELNGRPLSLIRLDHILELPVEQRQVDEEGKLTLVVLGSAEKRVAFMVESLIGETEIVVKALGKQMARVRNVSGATILGTGKVVVILNVADMVKSARVADESLTLVSRNGHKTNGIKTILVVDDSITTRTLEKNILESAGFKVGAANDGLEALEALRGGSFDLVISDVDMPRMDGFDLTAKLRSEDRFKELPVILVTALDSAHDKARGVDAGADAYIVKSNFDQKSLLETIEQFI